MATLKTYRTNLVYTAPQEQVLLLLLERAIKDQNDALAAMQRGARLSWIAAINHCRAIFLELQAALDPKVAPELTGHLFRTYAWALHQLVQAARTGDPERLREVREITCSLYQTWREVLQVDPGTAEPDPTADGAAPDPGSAEDLAAYAADPAAARGAA